MNHPYFREDMQKLQTTADKSLFESSDYYPSPEDEVYKGLPLKVSTDKSFSSSKYQLRIWSLIRRHQVQKALCAFFNSRRNCWRRQVRFNLLSSREVSMYTYAWVTQKKIDFVTKHFSLGKIPLGSIVEMTITSYNWNAVTHSHHPVSTKVWYVRWLYTSDPLTRPRNVRHGSWLRPVQWNNSPNGKFNPPAEGKTDLVQVPGGFNENFECIDVYNKDGSKKINCPQTRKTHNREFELNYVNPVKRTTVPVPNNGS